MLIDIEREIKKLIRRTVAQIYCRLVALHTRETPSLEFMDNTHRTREPKAAHLSL